MLNSPTIDLGTESSEMEPINRLTPGTQQRRSVFMIGVFMRGGIDHVAKTVYFYLLTYNILYKNTAYFGGENDVFAHSIYYWVSNRPCPHMIDAPAGYQ